MNEPSTRIVPAAQRSLPPISQTFQPWCAAANTSTINTVSRVASASLRVSDTVLTPFPFGTPIARAGRRHQSVPALIRLRGSPQRDG